MSTYPVLGICGPAGSGKDAVAAAVGHFIRAQPLALADPMKRLAVMLFDFTEDQCWGPSSSRNTADPKWTTQLLKKAMSAMENNSTTVPGLDAWLKSVLPDYAWGRGGGGTMDRAKDQLCLWYRGVLEEGIKRGELTPRYVLQTMGTEWGRRVDPNIWVKVALRNAKLLLENPMATYDKTRGVIIGMAGDPEPVPIDLVTISDVRFRNEVLAIKALGGQVWRIVPPAEDVTAAVATARAGAGAKHASEAEQGGIPGFWYDVRLANDKAAGLTVLENKVGEMVADRFLRVPQAYALTIASK